MQLEVQTPPKTEHIQIAIFPLSPQVFNFLSTINAMVLDCVPFQMEHSSTPVSCASSSCCHPDTALKSYLVFLYSVSHQFSSSLLIVAVTVAEGLITSHADLSSLHPCIHARIIFFNTSSTVQDSLVAHNGSCCHLTLISDYIYNLAVLFS